MSVGISAQGTLLARAPQATPGTFTNIAELKNLTPPAIRRNPIELTNHNDLDDSWIVGIRRSGECTFNLNWLPTNATHDHLTGLTKARNDGTKDEYKVTYPDGTGVRFFAYVTELGPTAPVDDALTASVTLRPTGTFIWF